MKGFCKILFVMLMAAHLIFIGSCKEDEAEEFDSRLVGKWSNNKTDEDLKEFTIKEDGTFEVSLNPGDALGGRGTVTGKLSRDGSDFMMDQMKETTGTLWGSSVSGFNRTYVQITFGSNNNSFTLNCKDSSPVELFFGGIYYKQP
jgi:hypothetical protein